MGHALAAWNKLSLRRESHHTVSTKPGVAAMTRQCRVPPLGLVGLLVVCIGISSSGFAFESPRVTALCLGEPAKSTVVRESAARPEGPSRLRWYAIDNRTADGRRIYRPLAIAATWANRCDDWSHCDHRVGRLLTTTSPPVLIVGQRRTAASGAGEMKPEKIDSVYDVSTTGVPLEGGISVKVPPGDFRSQRAWLQKLKGVPIEWIGFDPVSQEMDTAIRTVVEEVRFVPLGKQQGAGTRVIPTGETLARLGVSGTWTSLIRRRPLDSATLLGVVLTFISTVVTLFFRSKARSL